MNTTWYTFLALIVLFMHPLAGEVMDKNAKIYVAGHNGLVGSALIRALTHQGYPNIITRTSAQLDLRNQKAVEEFFAQERPDYVFLAAAKVGGINANNIFPAQFIYENLMIECNVIHAAYTHGVKKLLFLGSSCIYPKLCPQPMREEYLLTGALEATNEPYAIAKIAGLNLCKSYNRQYGTQFISCMPTNLYGPHDNFNLETSHVLPALIAKVYKAYIENDPHVIIWGSGTPRREFLFVDDLADATIFLMNNYIGNDHINIGVGYDITIAQLTQLIADIIGYKGAIILDPTKPDGTPQKLLNIDKISALGWKAQVSLREGIERTVEWYVQNYVIQKKEWVLIKNHSF